MRGSWKAKTDGATSPLAHAGQAGSSITHGTPNWGADPGDPGRLERPADLGQRALPGQLRGEGRGPVQPINKLLAGRTRCTSHPYNHPPNARTTGRPMR